MNTPQLIVAWCLGIFAFISIIRLEIKILKLEEWQSTLHKAVTRLIDATERNLRGVSDTLTTLADSLERKAAEQNETGNSGTEDPTDHRTV